MDSAGYTRLSSRELYRNPWLAVEVHAMVHPNGEPGEHLLVATPQPCAVVVEDAGDVLFALQPRFAAARIEIEIVKGGRDPGETALKCAQRELREELGIVARDWSRLGILYEVPSIVSEPVTIFVARHIRFEAPEPERQESIRLVRMPVRQALEAVQNGEIDDGITAGALLRYALASGILAVTENS